MSRFLRSVRNDRSASLEMTPPCHSEEVADRRRNLLSIPPAVLQTNPLSPRVFGRKCGKTALEFILLADAATIPPISVALPDASAPGQPSEAHFPHLRPGGSSLAARIGKSTLPQGFHHRGGETGTLDNDLLSPSSCHSDIVKARPLVIPRRSQSDKESSVRACRWIWLRLFP